MARRLPEPIKPGWGYCITRGFDARLSAVRFNNPSIVRQQSMF
jgi:hypothetical protein